MKSACKRNYIIYFLKREDNSDCMPGKKDTVKVGKGKAQKYILNDTMSNLHKKLNQENPGDAVSRSFFFKSQPKNVCLCQKHQNFAWKLTAFRLRTQLLKQLKKSSNKYSVMRSLTGCGNRWSVLIKEPSLKRRPEQKRQ